MRAVHKRWQHKSGGVILIGGSGGNSALWVGYANIDQHAKFEVAAKKEII